MEWMILPLKRYAVFSGRSCRKEYWMFILFTVIVSLVLSLIDAALGLGGHSNSYSSEGANGFAAGAGVSGGILANAFSLAVLIPTIAVGVRRLHDIDRSGWWMAAPVLLGLGIVSTVFLPIMALGAVLGLAMFVVIVLLFVWACMRGTAGPNRFGPDPLAPLTNLEETFR